MRLLYCYIQFLDENGNSIRYRGQYQVEMNFSTTEKFLYDASSNTLMRENRKAPLPADFWVDNDEKPDYRNIYNVNIIAGDNGAGKTTAIRSILNFLNLLYTTVEHNKVMPSQRNIDKNRVLLLLESNEKKYLFNYLPWHWKGDSTTENLHTKGINNRHLHTYTCRHLEEFVYNQQDRNRNKIAELLLHTKIIHMTNTLSQYDYEHHLKNPAKHLRDPFIYDVSIGSTIGSDVGQYFLYEVYKQVRYVFDKNQAAKRKELSNKTDVIRSIMPHSLSLRLRLDQYRDDIENNNVLSIHNTHYPLLEKHHSLYGYNLPTLLGMLCVSAFADNLGIRLENGHLPISRNNLITGNTPDLDIQNVLKNQLEQLNTRFNQTIEGAFFNGHKDKITCVAYLPNDETIVSGSADGRLIVWQPFDTNTHDKYPLTLTGHQGEITCIGYILLDRLLISGSTDGSLRIWDLEAERCLRILEAETQITCLVVFQNKYVFSGYADGSLRVWDTHSGLCVRSFNFNNKGISCLAINQTQNYIIWGSLDGSLGLLNTYDEDNYKLWKETPPITCVSFLDNDYFISGSADGTLKLWNVSSKECHRIWKEHSESITCLAPFKNRSSIVTGSADHTLRIWDINHEHSIQTMRNHTKEITCVTVLDNGQIVSGSRDATIKLWNPDTHQCINLESHNDAITCLGISHNHRSFISGSADRSIQVWDINKTQPTYIFQSFNTKDSYNTKTSGLLTQIYQIDKEDKSLLSLNNLANSIKQNCLEYLDFLQKKHVSLFNLFTRSKENTFELSLDTSKQATYQDMMDFIQKYSQICKPIYTIDFDWGLSSGEENMLRIFSNLYNIFDWGSTKRGHMQNKIYNSNILLNKCDTVLLFMDEADLTLHPDWQRQLVAILIASIPRIYPASCVKDIQLILSTHSPLLLGDIPSENITYLYSVENQSHYLQDNTNNDEQMTMQSTSSIPGQTFGQNIHTILKDGFSLRKGTVGAFAANKINNVAKRLNEIIDQTPDKNDTVELLENELVKIRQIINLVAPGVLRIQLEELFQKATNVLNKQQKVDHSQAKQLLQALWILPQEEQEYVQKIINQGKKQK